MSIRKFATAAILDAQMGQDIDPMRRQAHRAVFQYQPREGYLYVRSRAISSRCNDNFDMFPAEEIEKSYLSFIGKPVFVNHHNEDHRRARGVIIDAAIHRDKNPDGTPDTWVELLHEVDAVKFPKLAKAIIAKEVNRTSMGCDVQFSKCSICNNVATSPLEYCAHIPGKKGKRIAPMAGKVGEREAMLVFEICSGLSFFENSLLVEQPADPTAFFLGDVEYGPGMEHMAKTASKDETDRWLESHTPAEYKKEYNKGWNRSRNVGNLDVDLTTPMEHGYYDHATAMEKWHSVHCTDPGIHETCPEVKSFDKTAGATWQRTASRTTNSSNSIWGLIRQASEEEVTTPTIWDLIKQADRIGDDLDNDLRENDPAYWNRLGNVQPPTTNWQRKAKLAKLNDDHPYETLTPSKPVTEMNDDEKTAHRAALKEHAAKWAARNPVHPQNIVDHWNAASPEEKENGKNWYSDAHHTARIIAQGTNTPLHATAGLFSNYSPQTHWATNVINAAKVARTKVGIGGKGNKHGEPALTGPNAGKPRGIMASEGQRVVGHALANAPHDEDEARAQGVHYEQLLKGPKTQAFARLIHNGGDDHSVVVDRHAYSVASGARASDAAYGFSGLGGKKKYNEVSQAYHHAARQISEQEGQTIHPHQVQAATWLVRQRLNEAGDRELAKKGSRSASAARSAIAEMHHYMGEHHPEASLQMPGTGYSKETGLVTHEPTNQKESQRFLAYGETKAPRDVNTLRAENCAICGNSEAFDGTQCQVCGYVAPPRPFGDPDTDLASQNDIRKQVVDGDQADPSDPDQQLGNQVGDPEILDDQAADAESGASGTSLTCTNCGTGIVPTPPTSDGEEGAEPAYPAEGDVCPVCKKGELLSESDPNEDADQDGVPDDAEVPQDNAEASEQAEAEEDAQDEDPDADDDAEANDEDDDDEDDKKPFPPKGKK